MITVDIERVGRKWNGRKLYRIAVKSGVGQVIYHNQPRRLAWRTMSDVVCKMVVEERSFQITGVNEL